MGTSVTQTNGTAFTWDNQSLVWTDALVGYRSWASPYDVIGYALSVDEDLPIFEVLSNGPGIQLVDAFAISEEGTRRPGIVALEPLTFTEEIASSYRQFLSEPWSIGSYAGNWTAKALTEEFAVAEQEKSTFGLIVDRTLDFTEDLANSTGFIRNYDESLTITEAQDNKFGLNFAQSFSIIDSWRRAADMVISDMIVGNGDMHIEDFDDFIRYGNAPGYTKWRDFVPGDYEYQEALIRAVLESKNSDRGMLTGLQISIDVPDLIDRGSATITSASTGVTVTYGKNFHIIPEITLATKGGVDGTTLTPHLVSATKTSFVVKMKDQTGALAAGSFTWAAHGY